MLAEDKDFESNKARATYICDTLAKKYSPGIKFHVDTHCLCIRWIGPAGHNYAEAIAYNQSQEDYLSKIKATLSFSKLKAENNQQEGFGAARDPPANAQNQAKKASWLRGGYSGMYLESSGQEGAEEKEIEF